MHHHMGQTLLTVQLVSFSLAGKKSTNMKRLTAIFIVAMLLFTLCACSRGGDVSTHGRRLDDSNVYTEEDIIEAMNVVEAYFKKEFEGCKLNNIEYVEKDSIDAAAEWAEQYGTEQAIVLVSEFDVNASGGDGSLNPNSTYKNWQWILTRNSGETWTLQTWGY